MQQFIQGKNHNTGIQENRQCFGQKLVNVALFVHQGVTKQPMFIN
jgi:hypothetical protein